MNFHDANAVPPCHIIMPMLTDAQLDAIRNHTWRCAECGAIVTCDDPVQLRGFALLHKLTYHHLEVVCS